MRGHFVVITALLVAGVAVVTGTGYARRSKPQPCPPGRYVVTQGAELIVGDSTPRPAVVNVAGKQIALGAHCPLITGSVTANKKGTTLVKAHWAACGTLSKVKLSATIPSDCHAMSGVVKAKKVKPQTFTASLSVCGDQVVDQDGGEECDGAGCADTSSCVACQCVPDTTTTTPVSSTTSTTVGFSGTCTLTGDDPCNTYRDCPPGPTLPPVTQDCRPNLIGVSTCGDGLQELPETCDRGTHNCGSGGACPIGGCTATCQVVGRCTGSHAACVTADSCPAGEGCCGNGLVETGETCDDGDTADGDGCPASCHTDACTVTNTSLLASVRYTGPAGVTISGLGVFVDYPEGKVSLLDQSKVTGAFSVSVNPQVLGYAFKGEAIKGGGGLPALFLHVSFNTCQGAPAAVTGDFTCVVLDASDDVGNPVDPSTVSCTVTVP